MPWRLGVKIQWVEPIILVGQVEHTEGYFRLAAPEAVTSQHVELPEFITRLRGIGIDVILRVPARFTFRKKAAGMIVDRVKIYLMQHAFHLLSRRKVDKAVMR